MSAIIEACDPINAIKNTGTECSAAMFATAQVLAIHPTVEFDLDDIEEPTTWANLLIHQRKLFPLFGAAAPVNNLENTAQQDVTITLDDGTEVLIRYAMFNEMLSTTEGGLCYANVLQSFNNSGFKWLKLDATGQMLVIVKSNGMFTGARSTFVFSPSPVMANMKDATYLNRFKMTTNPQEMVKFGKILKNAEELLNLEGLLDAKFFEAAAASTTKLKLGLQTNCAKTDLVNELGVDLNDVLLYIVKHKFTKVVSIISSALVVDGIIELTGTFDPSLEATVSGGAGTGATVEATTLNGEIISVEVVTAGSGYTSAPTIAFNGSGTGETLTPVLSGGAAATASRIGGAAATAVLTSQAVTSATVTAPGSGYTSAPTVVFTGGAGSGATATATLVDGEVTAIVITAGGTGYTSAPTISFTGGGTGTIGEIDVTDGGLGYTSAPTVVFTGGAGTGAAGTAVLTSGVVTSITITNAGSGYTSNPTIAFTGGGAGRLFSVTVVDGGSGFYSTSIYTVIGSTPEIWYSKEIEGYDASSTSGNKPLEITIP